MFLYSLNSAPFMCEKIWLPIIENGSVYLVILFVMGRLNNGTYV